LALRYCNPLEQRQDSRAGWIILGPSTGISAEEAQILRLMPTCSRYA
jgi:hypothetical protein